MDNAKQTQPPAPQTDSERYKAPHPEGAAGLGACREKYWEECSVEEKLDRMRDAIMNINSDQIQLGEGVIELLRHSHDGTGAIVAPLRQPGMNDALSSYSRDRTWRLRRENEREGRGHRRY